MEIGKDISLEKLAYIAGILDGEGCLTISKKRRKPCKSNPHLKGVCLTPLITVANKSKRLMEELINLFGDIASYRPYDFNNPLRRGQSYMFQISTYSGVVKFLEAVYPYLIIKKRQAEVLLEFCKRRLKLNPLRCSNKERKYTDDDFKLYELIHKLNKGEVL